MLVVMSRMGDIGFGVFGLMDPYLYSTELEQSYVSLILYSLGIAHRVGLFELHDV